MELKFDQYIINGTAEEMAVFLTLREPTAQRQTINPYAEGNGTTEIGHASTSTTSIHPDPQTDLVAVSHDSKNKMFRRLE